MTSVCAAAVDCLIPTGTSSTDHNKLTGNKFTETITDRDGGQIAVHLHAPLLPLLMEKDLDGGADAYTIALTPLLL